MSLSFATVTFDNVVGLRRLLSTVRSVYKDVKIHVANNGRKNVASLCREFKSELHNLEYDIGLSAARNYLSSITDTEYVVMLDDDMYLKRNSGLHGSLKYFDSHGLDIIVPKIRTPQWKHTLVRWYGSLFMDDGILKRVRQHRPWVDGNLVGVEAFPPGAMIARRSALLKVPFDARLKQCEGLEFCWRAKNALRVALCTSISVVHFRTTDPAYWKRTSRVRQEYQALSYEVMNVKSATTTRKMVGVWSNVYLKGNRPPNGLYGDDDISAKKAAEFFDQPDIQTIEDWGCGWCGFSSYISSRQKYFGIDGSSPKADKRCELVAWTSDCDAILLRHVLEHNKDWRIILQHAINSFRKRLVIVICTRFSSEQRVVSRIPNWKKSNRVMVDISFKKDDVVELLSGCKWTYELVESHTQYGQENIFYVKR
jgi:hypothetical protein